MKYSDDFGFFLHKYPYKFGYKINPNNIFFSINGNNIRGEFPDRFGYLKEGNDFMKSCPGQCVYVRSLMQYRSLEICVFSHCESGSDPVFFEPRCDVEQMIF